LLLVGALLILLILSPVFSGELGAFPGMIIIVGPFAAMCIVPGIIGVKYAPYNHIFITDQRLAYICDAGKTRDFYLKDISGVEYFPVGTVRVGRKRNTVQRYNSVKFYIQKKNGGLSTHEFIPQPNGITEGLYNTLMNARAPYTNPYTNRAVVPGIQQAQQAQQFKFESENLKALENSEILEESQQSYQDIADQNILREVKPNETLLWFGNSGSNAIRMIRAKIIWTIIVVTPLPLLSALIAYFDTTLGTYRIPITVISAIIAVLSLVLPLAIGLPALKRAKTAVRCFVTTRRVCFLSIKGEVSEYHKEDITTIKHTTKQKSSLSTLRLHTVFFETADRHGKKQKLRFTTLFDGEGMVKAMQKNATEESMSEHIGNINQSSATPKIPDAIQSTLKPNETVLWWEERATSTKGDIIGFIGLSIFFITGMFVMFLLVSIFEPEPKPALILLFSVLTAASVIVPIVMGVKAIKTIDIKPYTFITDQRFCFLYKNRKLEDYHKETIKGLKQVRFRGKGGIRNHVHITVVNQMGKRIPLVVMPRDYHNMFAVLNSISEPYHDRL
jgi:hypothetical protein